MFCSGALLRQHREGSLVSRYRPCCPHVRVRAGACSFNEPLDAWFGHHRVDYNREPLTMTSPPPLWRTRTRNPPEFKGRSV